MALAAKPANFFEMVLKFELNGDEVKFSRKILRLRLTISQKKNN